MKLRLYVINIEKYGNIIETVKKSLESSLSSEHDFEVINVLEQPDLAKEDNVIFTPTLINLSTDPPKRVVGNMMEKEKILIALNILEK